MDEPVSKIDRTQAQSRRAESKRAAKDSQASQLSPFSRPPDVGGAMTGGVAAPTARPPVDRLIRLVAVAELTGLGKTTIYQLQKAGAFPHSIAVTRFAVRWVESEVVGWIEAQKGMRTPRASIAAQILTNRR